MPHKDPKAKVEYRAKHRERDRQRARQYVKENPERNRLNGRKWKEGKGSIDSGILGLKKYQVIAMKSHIKKYGITLDQYMNRLVAQNGVCAICKNVCSSGRRLGVDHDHETGKIRGLLCDKCNRGIGIFQDDIRYLINATKYLMDHFLEE